MEYDLVFILLNVVIAIGILAKIYVMYGLIQYHSEGTESLIRILALTCGCLIYLITKAFDFSVTDILVSALTTGNLIDLSIYGFLFPIIAGISLTYYIVRTVRSSETKAMRILILISTISIFQYGDLYITATQLSLEELSTSRSQLLVTNVMFTISSTITIIFKYEPAN